MMVTCSLYLSRSNSITGPRKISEKEDGYVSVCMSGDSVSAEERVLIRGFFSCALQVSASEAKDICQQGWMKEALDVLVSRVMQQQREELVQTSRA